MKTTILSLEEFARSRAAAPAWEETLCFLAGVLKEDALPLLEELGKGEGLRRLALAARATGELSSGARSDRLLGQARNRVAATFCKPACAAINKRGNAELPLVLPALEALQRSGAEIQGKPVERHLAEDDGIEYSWRRDSLLAALQAARLAGREPKGNGRGEHQEAVEVVEHPKDKTLLAKIPVGEFRAGGRPPKSQSDDDPGEEPFPVVVKDAFWLALHPVMNRQYCAFLASPEGRDLPRPPRVDDALLADHPVVNVSWEDAAAYCAWAGLRLPTEVEWEKGARGVEGWWYPWGNGWEPWRCRCEWTLGAEETSGVWEYREGRSPWGLYGMAGNVWEWCADWYEEDEAAHERWKNSNIRSIEQGGFRVLRGGSFRSVNRGYFRCAVRCYHRPADRLRNLGFRVARTA